jgi:hypothetical protein
MARAAPRRTIRRAEAQAASAPSAPDPAAPEQTFAKVDWDQSQMRTEFANVVSTREESSLLFSLKLLAEGKSKPSLLGGGGLSRLARRNAWRMEGRNDRHTSNAQPGAVRQREKPGGSR